MSTINKEQKQSIVNKIKHSTCFKKATTSSALLQYLHEATLQNIDITETVIHIEFFGAKENTEKSTPKVRVNVYNLRKKLEQYYKEEGLYDPWQIKIKKGQYQVLFEKKTSEKTFFNRSTWKTLLPWSLLIVTCAILLAVVIPPKTPRIWKSFLSPKASTQLYVGDVFGMVGPTAFSAKGWTRDYSINSFYDYYDYMKKHPNLEEVYQASPFTLVNGMAVTSAQNFQHFFQKHKREFNIRFSTKTTTSEIKEGNAIFIGNIWNHNPFIRFFNEANPNCFLDWGNLYLSKNKENAKSYKIKSTSTTVEYSIVAKYPATGDTDHLLFFSQHGIGVAATTEYFTCQDSVIHFTEKYLEDKDYFTAIFKVNGQDRTNISIEVDTVVAF